jgi:nicastrin
MQLVFVVFTGEAWGYLGSRRFLVELDEHSDAVHGLNHSLIEKVLSPILLVNMTNEHYWRVT